MFKKVKARLPLPMSNSKRLRDETETQQATLAEVNREITSLTEKRQRVLDTLVALSNEQRQLDEQEAQTRADLRWARYNLADDATKKVIYQEALQELLTGLPRYTLVTSGCKWDTLGRTTWHHHKPTAVAKIQKSDGGVYWTGKHSKCNIIRDPLHRLSMG
jgi:erythromycin esterase-like protein